jgi:prophage regulatory protein
MRILRLRQVEEATGLKKSAIYERIADGRFSKPISLGPQAVGWLESEVNDWIAQRVAERDTAEQS